MIYYSRMQVLSFKYILSRLSNQLQYSFLKVRNKISIFDPILPMHDLIPLTNDLLFSYYSDYPSNTFYLDDYPNQFPPRNIPSKSLGWARDK